MNKTQTTKVKSVTWRLPNLPTPKELLDLVNNGLMEKEDAQTIMFSTAPVEVRTRESMEEEIKFLRQCIERLTTNRTQLVDTIRYIEKPFKRWDWYQPYQIWCSSTGSALGTAQNLSLASNAIVSLNSGTNTTGVAGLANTGFGSISTF